MKAIAAGIFYRSAYFGLVAMLAGTHLLATAPAHAGFEFEVDYSAEVTFDPPELVLECVETLRPSDTPNVTLEIVEVPSALLPPTQGKYIIGGLNFVTDMVSFSGLEAFVAEIPEPPQFLAELDQRYSGRMDIKYGFVNNPDPSFVQDLKNRGFRKMKETRTVPTGDQTVAITRYYKTNSAFIPSYGTMRAVFTLRAQSEIDTDEHSYKTGYRLVGKIDSEIRNLPSGAIDRDISEKLRGKFETRMTRKSKRIVGWLNKPRPLFTGREFSTIGKAEEGEILDSATDEKFKVKEINFPFCSKPQTILPRVVLTVLRRTVVLPDGGSPLNQPLGE